jgi:hypothetical protein
MRSWSSSIANVIGMFALGLVLGCGGDESAPNPVSCGPGTTLDEANTCVRTPDAPPLSDVKITLLDSHYDESAPVFVNHKLSLRLGLTSTSPTVLKRPVPMLINIGLFEDLPVNTSQEAINQAHSCFIHGHEVELDGSGKEQVFQFDDLVIPPDCLPEGRSSMNFNVIIQLDQEVQALPQEFERLFYFTESGRTRPANALCRSRAGGGADGCVHHFRVQPSPGFDLDEKIHPDSAIALFWNADTGQTASTWWHEQRPMMSLQVDLLAYGHDPFDLGAGSDVLPGTVSERIRIAPADGPHAGEYKPLYVQAASADAPDRVSERTFDKLKPSSENEHQFELYATQDIINAVVSGDWKNTEEFVIEACLKASFALHGEPGELSEDEEDDDADSQDQDCEHFTVLGVRAQPPSAQAARLDIGTAFVRDYGNDIASINVLLETNSHVSVGEAVSATNASASLKSSYLPDIEVARAHAYAGLDLFALDKTAITARLDVFGSRLYSYATPQVPGQRELLAEAKEWSEKRCKQARFSAGPVPLAVEGCIQGKAGFTFNLGLARDGFITTRSFPSADTEGELSAAIRPYLEMGGTASASVDVLIVRAGIEGSLTVLKMATPLVARANVGLVRTDASTGRPSATVNLFARWDLDATPLTGSVSAYFDARGGKVEYCQGWFFSYPCDLPWQRVGSFSLMSFGLDPLTQTLVERTFTSQTLAP